MLRNLGLCLSADTSDEEKLVYLCIGELKEE